MEETYYTRVISFKLYTYFLRKIELMAINTGSNKSEVIRKILLDYITNYSQDKPLINSRAELLIDGNPDSRVLVTVKVSGDVYEKVVNFARQHNTTISSVVMSALYYALKDDRVTFELKEENRHEPHFRVCPICGLIIPSSFDVHLQSHKRISTKHNRLIKYRDIMLLAQEAALQGDKEAIKEVLMFIKNRYSKTVYDIALKRTKYIYSKIIKMDV